LWIDDTIIVADVYDKWTASQIYEDIVDRRTDPAILYKYEYSGWNWNYYQYIDYTDYYMFKIFPMLTNLPRKAKITYLVRNNEGLTQNPTVVLPINILKLSGQNILNTIVRFFPDSNMVSPIITEIPVSTFTYHSNPLHGNYYETSVANASSNNSLSLSYTQTVINSVPIKTHFDASHSENFYQLQLKPIDLFGIPGNKKALFLFDFIDANCNSLNASQLLNQVKSKILSQFTTGDSVNFMFSGFITHSYSNNWISADPVSINNAFSTMNSTWFNTYSNLATLLYDGIQFIKGKNDIGSIVLIASSNTNGASQQANGLITNILSVMGSSDIPIHIIDLNEMNSPQYYIGGQYYYGND
jgi:Ca-activated chloride channel family protein